MNSSQNGLAIDRPDTNPQNGVTHFDEYLNKRVDLHERMEKDKSGKSVIEWYNSQASLYEAQFDTAKFAYPLETVNSFMELVPNKDARILDMCAGTGKIASLLQKGGYKNIDAMDGSESMLKIAKKKGLYINTHCCLVDTSKVDEIDDATYDAIIIGGGVAKGHLTLEAIPTVLRMIKEGGFLIFSYAHWNLQFADFSREKINEIIEMLQSKKLGCLVSEKSANHRLNENASIFNFKRGPSVNNGC